MPPQYSGYFPSFLVKGMQGWQVQRLWHVGEALHPEAPIPVPPGGWSFPRKGCQTLLGPLALLLVVRSLQGILTQDCGIPASRLYEFWCMQIEEMSSSSVLLLLQKLMDLRLKSQSMLRLITKMSTDWTEIRVLALKASVETWGLPPEASLEESWEQPQASSGVTFKI